MLYPFIKVLRKHTNWNDCMFVMTRVESWIVEHNYTHIILIYPFMILILLIRSKDNEIALKDEDSTSFIH